MSVTVRRSFLTRPFKPGIELLRPSVPFDYGYDYAEVQVAIDAENEAEGMRIADLVRKAITEAVSG